jgi:hypothetical protein
MMVDMKWTSDLLGATESASAGNSIKSEAIAFENILSTTTTIKIGLAKPADKRHLSELTKIWWELKGKHETHGRDYLGKIELFTKITSDPCAFQITKSLIK